MNQEDNDDIAAFGQRIGGRLAAAKLSVMQPGVAARVFVDALLAAYPNAKLPELVADAEVKRWLDRRALGEGHLRQALTAARRALRATDVNDSVKRPRARRKALATVVAPPSSLTVEQLSAGAVPIEPLDQL